MCHMCQQVPIPIHHAFTRLVVPLHLRNSRTKKRDKEAPMLEGTDTTQQDKDDGSWQPISTSLPLKSLDHEYLSADILFECTFLDLPLFHLPYARLSRLIRRVTLAPILILTTNVTPMTQLLVKLRTNHMQKVSNLKVLLDQYLIDQYSLGWPEASLRTETFLDFEAQ